MNLSRFLYSLLIITIITSCQSKKINPQPTPTPPTIVDVLIASAQPVDNSVELNGTVVANDFAELHPEISGRLTYLNVPEGNKVEKGTLIARVNDADLQAQLNKTKVMLALAQKTEERDRKLLAINGINQADYDMALNAVNGYKADMAYTQSLIDKTVVKAPFSGLIGLRQVSLGAYVSPSTVIATIQQVDKLKVDFNVPEIYSHLLHKGKEVSILLGDADSKRESASVIAIEPQANATTRNLKARALLESGKGNPGGFVKVYLESKENSKAILIPTNSLIANDRSNQVIVIKNGKAKFVDVKTGIRQATFVEIAKGINVGDSVVVTGVLLTRPNNNVTIKKVKQFKELSQ